MWLFDWLNCEKCSTVSSIDVLLLDCFDVSSAWTVSTHKTRVVGHAPRMEVHAAAVR